MFMRYILISLSLGLGIGAGSSDAVAGKIMTVRGAIQSWESDCDKKGNCSLPRPTGQVIKVVSAIKAPSRSSMGALKLERDLNSQLRVQLYIFWKPATHEHPQHIVYQQIVFRKNINSSQVEPIAKCVSYNPVPAKFVFPVGVCSGYTTARSVSGEFKNIGVTFYKAK
jgi:hypothetical protein